MCAAVAVMSAALMVPLTEQSAPTVTLAFPDARLVTAGTSFEPERVICWAPVAPIALSARSIIPQPPATAATAAATEVTSHVLFIAFSSCWGDYPLRDRRGLPEFLLPETKPRAPGRCRRRDPPDPRSRSRGEPGRRGIACRAPRRSRGARPGSRPNRARWPA